MTAYTTNTIALAEGHTIEGAAVYKKRRILDDLSISAVLGNASILTSIRVSKKLPVAVRFADVTNSDAYRAAVSRKDWMVVDRLILDVLARSRVDYARLLDAEEWMHAFSGRLCAEAKTAHAAYRWMDPPELDSYLGGTFESRVEGDHTRRGFKALSMNPSLNFLFRKVKMTVPLNCDMRRYIKCIRYTTLPRQVEVEDERITDEKGGGNANEAEIRVPDGTPVPVGTTFTARQSAPVDKRVIVNLNEMYAVEH